MKNMGNIGLKEVQDVYSGPEGMLWELMMGEQIYIGGFASSMDLAEKAGRGLGMKGVDLYLNMLNVQLTYDALRIIGFSSELMQAMGAEMTFMQELAHAGKIAQGLFVARKK